MPAQSLDQVVALSKRRGIIYPGSSIYGGFANSYSYGPYGIELKNAIRQQWWNRFVHGRRDMMGLEGSIIVHPAAWAASGHLDSFNDPLVEDTETRQRFRADHIIEEQTGIDPEGMTLQEMNDIIKEHNVMSPATGKATLGPARNFQLMFSMQMSKTNADDPDSVAYLRPETAVAMFLEFKNITQSTRFRLPGGVAQVGKAFRNEITPGNFTFRLLEFEQMEIEYFFNPESENWEELFDNWQAEMWQWCRDIGLQPELCHEAVHAEHKLSHYSKRTVDIEYEFPFGRKELYGLAYRTDYDLKQHMEHSGEDLRYRDPISNEQYIPHVIEPTFGLDRTVLALLCSAYDEETLEDGSTRTVLHLEPSLAPVKAAVLPLMKKDGMPELADDLYSRLAAENIGLVEYDDSGSIGKRYRRHDEIGTPFCLTVDYDSLEDGTVTVRHRDSLEQERMSIDEAVTLVAQACRTLPRTSL